MSCDKSGQLKLEPIHITEVHTDIDELKTWSKNLGKRRKRGLVKEKSLEKSLEI
ncbi:MAG: hypothetical protein IMW85_06145 [Thermicanus sp.]|nr:hypothetical protein [Thermicanus sp.]